MKTYIIGINRVSGKYIKYTSKEQAEIQGVSYAIVTAESWAEAMEQYREQYLETSIENE